MESLSHLDLPAGKPTPLERVLSALAAVGLVLLCIIVTTTVVVRAIGFVLIPDDVLLVQELMLGVVLLPLAAVTVRRRHIAVTVFTERLPLRGKAALALLAHAVGCVFAGALGWAGGRSLLAALASGEYYDGDLHLPTWIGWGMFTFGTGVFLLRLILQLYLDARLLRGHRSDGTE